MKKVISTVLLCVLLVTSVFALASCNMVTGEYEAEVLGTEITYEFGAFGKVTITVDPIIGDESVWEGKYELNDEGDEITFTFEDEDAEEYSGTQSFAQGEENGTKYVKIGLVTYKAVD